MKAMSALVSVLPEARRMPRVATVHKKTCLSAGSLSFGTPLQCGKRLSRLAEMGGVCKKAGSVAKLLVTRCYLQSMVFFTLRHCTMESGS